jgi:hypothetical protein
LQNDNRKKIGKKKFVQKKQICGKKKSAKFSQLNFQGQLAGGPKVADAALPAATEDKFDSVVPEVESAPKWVIKGKTFE